MDQKHIVATLAGCALACGLGFAPTIAMAQETPCTIAYSGDQSEFIIGGAELFSRVENGLPGDTFTGSVRIDNGSDAVCELFASVSDVVSTGPEDTLERIAFSMAADEEAVVYDGSLQGASSGEPLGLGSLEPGESMEVLYDVVIPPELTNEYADTEVGMNAVIMAVEHPEDDAAAATEEGGASLAKTGDATMRLPFILVAAVAVVIGVRIAMARVGLFGRR